VLCQLSYGFIVLNPVGLEPTTTRLQGEVTRIVTTCFSYGRKMDAALKPSGLFSEKMTK